MGIESGYKMILVPFGDLHIGYKTFNAEKAQYVVDWICKKRDAGEDVQWIGMGDYFDNTPPSHVYYNPDTELISPQQQVFAFVELVKPIRHECIGLLYGNHEMRSINNKTGFDPIQQAEVMLNIPPMYRDLGTQHYFYVVDDGTPYGVFATHGSSRGYFFSTKVQSKIRKLLNLELLADADIYLMGHMHDYLHLSRQKIVAPNRLGRSWYIMTGAFVEYFGSYGETLGYTPVETACNAIHITKDDIRVERIC